MQTLRFAPLFALVLVLAMVGWCKDSLAQNTQPAAAEQTVDDLLAKAEKGDAEAQYQYGKRLYDSGTPKDQGDAPNWFQKAAMQGHIKAQSYLGALLSNSPSLYANAFQWTLKAAEANDPDAQWNLGCSYILGRGVPKNDAEALKWFTKAAQHGNVRAQYEVAQNYEQGLGVRQSDSDAARWYLKAAEQGFADAQAQIGHLFIDGRGVVKDETSAYKWWLLAFAHKDELGNPQAGAVIEQNLRLLETILTPTQRAEGQRMARVFQPRKSPPSDRPISREGVAESRPESTGSGFFITDDGYLVTNQHVADEGAAVRVLTGNGAIPAKVVKVDRANDLALLKVEGKFAPLAITSSRGVRLGSTAATVGFPNVGLQGYSPKLAKGEIASLSGIQDDARHFQISVPVQPGNSGGALVDERGNVIGVVVAKLSQKAAIATTGTLAENVSYAVKSSYLLSFLESVPDVAAKLKEPNTNDRKFEDVIKDAEQAAVLVLVY
jgi:S1-C subfamily serine protease